MELTKEQFDKISPYLPRQRGNVRIDNFRFVNAILYITENGCKWRSLPKHFGDWHSIYVRMNRWSKSGVLRRLFELLQVKDIIQIKMEAVCLDSTTVKVHPDGSGALKKTDGKALAGLEADSQAKFIWSPHLTVRL
jgi:transposase